MTPKEAWDIIADNVGCDCGPDGEGWMSEELEEAVETFHRLYAPERTAKALFPDSPAMWPKSDRVAR